MAAYKQIILASVILLSLLLFGTGGFVFIEGYTPSEALYMTIITVSTVGYEEVHPLSEMGRLFTSLLILTGFCSLAFVSHSVVESILENVWRKSSEMKKMQKKIDQLKNHYVICGFGRVGEVAADHFHDSKADFVVIEGNPELCEIIKEKGYLYVEGDATIEKSMIKAGIKEAKGLLALLGTDPDNLFIVLSARELNPTLRIVSRAEKSSSERKILQAGADNVVSPFTSAGHEVADDILLATGRSALLAAQTPQVKAVPQWVEVQNGSSMVNQTIEVLSNDIGRQIIGMRRAGTDSIFPEGNKVIMAGDAILVLDAPEELEDSLKTAPVEIKKIAIVDDNPVIVRLYVRLFQKAGFSPIVATNGMDGLEIITSQNPVAAVIDYKLPKLSGIDVCKKIRESKKCNPNIQLILFTAHEDKEIHAKALEAGANAVVIKSQNASEVIETVVQHLQEHK